MCRILQGRLLNGTFLVYIKYSTAAVLVVAAASFNCVRAETNSADVYSKRVLPLLRSPTGSSCKECHFGGIELSDLLSENEAESFAKLRAGGWIDAEHPGHSKLLTFVRRHGEETSPVIKKLRQKEVEALTAWIKAASSKPQLLAAKAKDDTGIELDAELIRYLRSDHVLSRFTDNIWLEMGRCINCHSPERNERQVKEHGEQMSWIVPHDPEATLEYLVNNGLVDLDDPEQSEIRTKPTELVEHGGGPKFPVGSTSDKRFLTFLRDYAKVVTGNYTSSEQLPEPNAETTRATEHFLRLVHLPEAWAGKLMRVDLYADSDAGWSKHRVATADSPVARDKLIWQGIMWTVAPGDKTPAKTLGNRKYQARIYVDRTDRMKNDPDARFSNDDFVATIDFDGPWKLGWREPKIVHAKHFRGALDRPNR